MDAPIEVLRIDQNTVSKELARFRPCDNETRCFYCREWALYIYKKHFVWNAKTQEDMTSVNVKPMDAGVHKVNFCEVTQVLEKKPKAQVITKQFEENEENGRDILDILKACQNWMTLPSAYSGLPNLFEQVEFNPFPDNIPLVHDEKDPSHMLDPLIIERQALCLPSDGFYLLKNLTSDILLSHSQPTCQHTKPESKLPSDLETDRAIFNENAAIAVKRALVEVGTALDQSWGPLNLFITQLKDHIVERNNLIGATGCQRLMDAFFVSQKYQPFVDYWAIEAPSYAKRKKGLTKQEISDLDRIVIAHFETLKQKADEFISQFVSTHLDQLGDLTTQLWKLIATAITEMNQRIHSLESLKEIQDEISKNKDGSGSQHVKKWVDDGKLQSSLEKVSSAAANPLSAGDKKTIGPELDERAERFKREIDDLVASYLESNNRVEKLNNKEFKKRIKKVESGYYSLRQYFRTDVITKIFPEPLFCKFVVVCLESLMQEGELMESFTLHKKIKEFGDTYRDLQSQRLTLLAHFEEGVQTGRRELAGILGKLFLKEGMRIQGESLALKRQNNLLKSMGVAVGEEPNSKKKKKKKGTASTKSTATPPKSSTPTPSASDTPVEIPNNNPMVPDFVAEATPPPVKQEEEKAFIVEEPKEEVQPKKKKSATSENKKDKPVASPQLVKETKEKTNEVNSIEEWKNMKNAHKSIEERQVISDGWNTIPVKSTSSTPVKQPPSIKKETVAKPASGGPEWPSIGPQKSPEIQDWSTLRSEMTEETNGWASIASSDINDIPPKQQVAAKKKAPPKGEEWPSIAPTSKGTTTGDGWSAAAASSGWSSIVNKATPKSTPTTSIPASPSKPATPTTANEEWPSVSTENKASGWPAVSSSTENKASEWSAHAVENTVSSWSTMVTKTTESSKDNWSAVQEKSSDGGWSSPMAQEKPSGNGDSWSSPSTQINSVSHVNKSTETANQGRSTPVAEPIKSDGWSNKVTESANNERSSSSVTAKPENGSNKPSSSESTGWSAAKSTKNNNNDSWSKTATDGTNTNWTINTAELDKEWSPEVTETTTSAWSSNKKTRKTSNSGWTSTPAASETNNNNNNNSWGGKPSKTNRWATKNDSSENLGGWGAISSSTSTTAGGNTNSNNNAWDRNEPTESAQWEKVTTSTNVSSSWDPTSPVASGTSDWENRSNSDNWRTKSSQHHEKPNPENNNRKWADSQLPWKNVSSAPIESPQQQQQPPSIPQDNSNDNAAMMNRPPGLPMNEMTTQPSNFSNNATTTAPPQQPTQFAAEPIATPAASVPDQTAAIAMLSAAQLQAPLPSNLDELGSDNLTLLARNLHNQNSQLIQTVYSMQSEITMMTRRYSDIITLTREKEQQTLQLLEARRQTDLEEARRYVLNLEARIKQLEYQTKITAGFGNQDLFAGYRDEMGGGQHPQHNNNNNNNNNNRRKMWSKHYSLRCGNCGQEGHASNDCTSLCRYCGNSDHLSDACPNNS